jgi:phytoene synthase
LDPALLDYLPPEHSLKGLAWRFVPAPDQQPALALAALVDVLGRAGYGVSDPAVALAKLAWWQNEISGLPGRGSQHPLLRTLLEHHSLQGIDIEGLTRLAGSVAGGIDAPPPANLAALKQQALRLGGDEALVLSGLGANHALAPALRAAGAVVHMLGRLEALVITPDAGCLPLDLVARFQLQRSEAANSPAAPPPGLVQALADAVVGWWPADQWPGLKAAPELRASITGRYWLLGSKLAQRRVLGWASRPSFWVQRVHPPTLAEVLFAWRLARQIYRPRGPSR